MNMAIKRMSVKKFRELGYLQELNRQFLHPLGLAIEVTLDEDGCESFGSVWDSQHDPEGIRYAYLDPGYTDPERLEGARKKAKLVKEKQDEVHSLRRKALGYLIEPLE